MRGFVPQYELITKSSLQETLQALSQEPSKWKVFAGGTDLMVLFESGRLKHQNFLNLASFKELRKIEVLDSQIRIGALSTYSDIQNHPVIQKEFPLMVRSGWVTGAKAIQNRGTIGGNIANASPAADTPPSLLAYGAEVELMSEKGTRVIEYSKFHKDYKKMDLAENEIVSAVLLKRNLNWTHHYYRKIGTRAFQSISKVAVSAAASVRNGRVENIQVGLASVGPMPMRAFDFENSLKGLSLDQLQFDPRSLQAFHPISDIRSTADYRKTVLGRVAEHLLDVLKSPPGNYLES